MGMLRSVSRKKRNSTNGSNIPMNKIKLTKEDQKHFKTRSGDVHDPVLSAMNEAQPFEQNQAESKQVSIGQYVLNNQIADVFGDTIAEPDISNPTRSRNERPLDTIRKFEYAISGDLGYRDLLETNKYGFQPRNGFIAGFDNPYGSTNHVRSNPSTTFTAPVYQAPPINSADEKKKKKRSFFGRKKQK